MRRATARLSILFAGLGLCHPIAAGPACAADTAGNSPWARLFSPELRALDARQAAIRTELEPLPQARFRAGNLPLGYRSQSVPAQDAEKWVQVDLGREYPVDDIVLVPAWLKFGDFPGPGFGFPVRFRVEVAAGAAFHEPFTVADFTASDVPNPGLAPVSIRAGGRRARFVRVTATRLWRRIDDCVFALGELLVVSGNRNRSFQRRAIASDSFESPGMWSLAYLTDDNSVLGNPTDVQMLPTNGHHSDLQTSADVVHWVQVDLGRTLPIEEVRLVAARPIDFPDTIGFGFPVRFRLEGSASPDFTDPFTIADHTGGDFPNPGERPVVFPAAGKQVRTVRLTATRLWQRGESTWVMALAEMEVFSGGRNAAAEQQVIASDTVADTPRWHPQFLVDGIAPRPGFGSIVDWLAALARRQSLETELSGNEARRSRLLATAEFRLLWTAGGLVTTVAAASVLLHRRVRSRHRREALRMRQDIAQDLHDEVGSNLGSIAILSQMAIDAAPDAASMRTELEEIHRVAQQTTASMRDIVWLISPGDKTTGDLAERLRASAAALLAGMEWHWSASALHGTLSLDAQRDVLLILKEALHNIRRHARAGRVDVRVSEANGEFCMEIQDDGTGFEPGTPGGHGLANMRRRAQRLKGRLHLDSTPGRGTRLVLSLPLS